MKLARWGRAWPAPAKLNLFLHVLGRRADGYHRLQTAFQFLDFGDTLVFEARRDGSIRRPEGPDAVPEEDDLAVRAAALLKSATALVALNHLWKTGLTVDELAALGARLGADVPVFVRGRAAFADGRGDVLEPADWPRPWYLVVNPGCQVATGAVFAAPELTRNTPETTIEGFLSEGGRNDFEPVVRNRFPEVGDVLDWLSSYGPARMTGTGGCCFLDFDSEVMARAVLQQLPQPWTGFVARGLNRSPLTDYRSV